MTAVSGPVLIESIEDYVLLCHYEETYDIMLLYTFVKRELFSQPRLQ